MSELQFLSVYQGKNRDGYQHKSSIAYGGKRGGKTYIVGNIPHGAELTFAKKDIPKIVKLLQMENSPFVKD